MKNFYFLLTLLSNIIFSQTDGTLDVSFGSSGKVVTNVSSGVDFASDGIQLSDNKILVGGYANQNGQDNLVLKYLSNGQLDTSFGNNGVSIIELGTTSSQVRKIGTQSDGKIILAGRAGNSGPAHSTISRLNQDGTLDLSFGVNGYVTHISGSESDIQGLSILDNDKIIVVGYTLNSNADIKVIKLNSNGTYDNSFGNNGVVILDFGSLGIRAFCSIMNGNKILIGGVICCNPDESSLVLQLNADGSLDTSFGNNGWNYAYFGSSTGFYDHDRFLTITLKDNKIYAVGSKLFTSIDYQINLAKFNIDGSLDTSFDSDGMLTINTSSQKDFIHDIKILEDNSILMAGISSFSSTSSSFLMVKLNPDGTLNSDFGNNGLVLTNLNSTTSGIQKLIVNENNIIAIGNNNISSSANVAMAKYHNSNPVLNINEIIDQNNKPYVFPNPFKNYLNINFKVLHLVDKIEIYENTGRLVYWEENPGQVLNLSFLKSGTYIFKFYADKNLRTIKVIKE